MYRCFGDGGRKKLEQKWSTANTAETAGSNIQNSSLPQISGKDKIVASSIARKLITEPAASVIKPKIYTIKLKF